MRPGLSMITSGWRLRNAYIVEGTDTQMRRQPSRDMSVSNAHPFRWQYLRVLLFVTAFAFCLIWG